MPTIDGVSAGGPSPIGPDPGKRTPDPDPGVPHDHEQTQKERPRPLSAGIAGAGMQARLQDLFDDVERADDAAPGAGDGLTAERRALARDHVAEFAALTADQRAKLGARLAREAPDLATAIAGLRALDAEAG